MSKKYCENCGAACKSTATFCHMCNASLATASDDSYKSISGISTSELNTLIDKNAGRYMEVLSDNEDKKVFLHFNWAAFFAPEIWLLYRKMYLYFFLKLIASVLILALVVFGAVSYCSSRIESESENTSSAITPNQENFENLPDDIKAQYLSDFKDAVKNQIPFSEQAPALVNIAFFFTILLINFVFSLFADCIYRRYLIKHYEYYCGISVPSAVWGTVGIAVLALPDILYRILVDFDGLLMGILKIYF